MATESSWGIPEPVRTILDARVSELRVGLQEDARRQLAALGIAADLVGPPPGDRSLSADENKARDVVLAVLATHRDAGESREEALRGYAGEVAFTLFDRLVTFRCLEERGLLLVDGQAESLVRRDLVRGTSSLIWRTRDANPGLDERAIARTAYRAACAAMTDRVKVLFDPDDEPSALFPTLPLWQKAMDALNDPAIPSVTFAQDEIMGWVYQYWSASPKRELFEQVPAFRKIAAGRDLALASCTYTPRYIVDYLVQNTLGTTWVEIHPDSALPATWPYYVTPPAGNPPVEREPKRVRDITLIDPCVGSGHFLVRAFDLFAQLYAEEGIEKPEDVPGLILEHNLYGADIDRRAVQIAALALYVKGCNLVGSAFRPRKLNLVACDIAIPPDPPADFLASLDEPELKDLAKSLWTGLAGIRIFGSLLHPERRVNEAFAKLKASGKGTLWEDDTDWDQKRAHFMTGLRKAFTAAAGDTDLSTRLFGEEGSRGLDALQILGRRYDVVVTNPPYVGFRKISPAIRDGLKSLTPSATLDLYVAFVDRCRAFTSPAGLLGMIAPQSWLTSTRTLELRTNLAEEWPRTVVGLGQGVFADAALVFAGVFTWQACPHDRRSLGTVRINDRSFEEALLAAVRSRSFHTWPIELIRRLPTIPFLPDAPRALIELLSSPANVGRLFEFVDGAWGGDNEQFTRRTWEVDASLVPLHWMVMSAGKGYARWWRPDDQVVKRLPDMPSGARWEYGRVAGGRLSAREGRPDSTHLAGVVGLYPKPGVSGGAVLDVAALLNSRVGNLYLRTLVSGLNFNPGYCGRIPVADSLKGSGVRVATAAIVELARGEHDDLGVTVGDRPRTQESVAAGPLRLALEAQLDNLVACAYTAGQVELLDEFIPRPAGWNPLLVGYDRLPHAPEGIEIPAGLADFIATLEHRPLSKPELARVKARLRTLYEAGPGAKEEVEESAVKSSDEGDEAEAAPGALIPIPTETFLEELSVKMEFHPISIYWLLEELRAEGVVSPPLRKAEIEEYIDITLVRMLGYRWPEQDSYEAAHGPILDADLVDPDGIIPLVPCGDEPVADERVRSRLVRQLGEDGADAFLADLRRYTKRDLADWIRRDFFKGHIRRFKNRPIGWHLRSPEGHFEALVLYHRLSRDTLAQLRVTYAGDRVARLRAEQQRARDRADSRTVTNLQVAIEDVEAFRRTLEAIERGDELKHRIRCRWKNETETGRAGPYAPEIDEGVKVNIRPFQESGLLAAKAINKW
jgi:hypothetical protein